MQVGRQLDHLLTNSFSHLPSAAQALATTSSTMSKLFIAALLVATVVVDPASAEASSTLLRAVPNGRALAEVSSASTDDLLTDSLYEANTKIKGCHWYDYFTPWSCCGANNC
ncbi:unnamed protein product [Phytophthora lilii]|uniref:Unnamed protein product n=1 Tax=Phytophthora lilii TaxID=2077276 RepID=A0A9W6TIK7_9STRA|nr:unnamed protein product [Phytophthora lilii]